MSRLKKIILSAVWAGVAGVLWAQDGSFDPTFNPTDPGFGNGDGASCPTATCGVQAIAVQPDGKILLGGGFNRYNGTLRSGVTRTNADGTIDTSFDLGTGASEVLAIALQPDGKILIGGEFVTYNGVDAYRLARLHSNGNLDLSFSTGTSLNGQVTDIAIQPDGKVIIVGHFTSYGGIPRWRIARLNSDGTLDGAFNSAGMNGAVTDIKAVALAPDGKIFIGGSFLTYNGITMNRIARLNSDGSLDNTFSTGTGANNTVYDLALQPDGKLVVGGAFTSYNGTSMSRIMRLNNDGGLDNTFTPGTGANTTVLAIRVRPDGKMIIGGAFTTFAQVGRDRIARLNNDGTLDNSFNAGSIAGAQVEALAVETDGRLVVGGQFSATTGSLRERVLRLEPNGTLDQTFNPGSGASPTISTVSLQADGKSVISGGFHLYNGIRRKGVARLHSDGSVDSTFDPGSGPSGSLSSLNDHAVQPDGKVIVAGVFETFNDASCNDIARLEIDGSRDTGFDPGTGTNNTITSIALQPDGKVIIAGAFTAYNGTTRNHIARLNADGSLDTSFDPGSGPNSWLYDCALQPDGKVLIAGIFTAVNGTPRNSIARLNPDGSLDGTFDTGTGANAIVSVVVAQADGRVLIGGGFTTYAGSPRTRIARLNANGSLDLSFDPGSGPNSAVSGMAVQGDGKPLIVGNFSLYNGVSCYRFGRLNTDGSWDNTFDPGSSIAGYNNPTIRSMAIQPDGRILIGGTFTSYNGIGRNRIARINGTPRAGIKLMLEGPYSGTSMNDALRSLPSFPLTEPFTAMGYTETGFTSGATIGSSVLSTTDNNAIVDWVLVEMRPVSTPGTVAASRAVLLQRDGDVVDLDGVSTVGFAGLAPGNYCVAVKPRNHLPVMLSTTTPVSYGSSGIATVDFTLPTTQVYDNDARKTTGGVMVLAAGDGTFNETVRYTGSGNDRDPIILRVGGSTPNNTVSGYWREDLNMDGVVKYTGSANDRDIILTNVGSTTPNNTRVATLP